MISGDLAFYIALGFAAQLVWSLGHGLWPDRHLGPPRLGSAIHSLQRQRPCGRGGDSTVNLRPRRQSCCREAPTSAQISLPRQHQSHRAR
jgi:hypothetical protein